MEKEFIPYKLAVKLKELEFNELCNTCYDKLGMTASYGENVFDYKNYNISEYVVSRSTFSQAFRWFRENGFLIDFSSHDKDTHDFYIKWGLFKQRGSILSDAYNTYEEAELACLQKMIEIVENNLSN